MRSTASSICLSSRSWSSTGNFRRNTVIIAPTDKPASLSNSISLSTGADRIGVCDEAAAFIFKFSLCRIGNSFIGRNHAKIFSDGLI